jgi:hypothetical protein
MKIPAGHYYIPDTPRENGYLLIEVTKDRRVRVVSPAVKWWRDRVFATVEEFGQVWLKETMFRDPDLLQPQMGHFQNYYGRLFVHQGDELGWRYIKGVSE